MASDELLELAIVRHTSELLLAGLAETDPRAVKLIETIRRGLDGDLEAVLAAIGSFATTVMLSVQERETPELLAEMDADRANLFAAADLASKVVWGVARSLKALEALDADIGDLIKRVGEGDTAAGVQLGEALRAGATARRASRG